MRILLPLVLAGLILMCAGSPDAQAGPREFLGHHRQVMPVVVVPELRLADLRRLAPKGAVGLMVPSAGPRTSAALAFSGIVRGVLHNGRLGSKPDAPVLIRVEHARAIPVTAPVIVLGLPPARPTPNDRRYPVAVLGACRGILDSSLTRVPGLVSAADVARTALGTAHALRCRPDRNAVRTLDRLEQRVQVARTTAMPGTVIVLGIALVFALLLPAATLPAVASALAVNLALGWLPAGGTTSRLTLFAVCTAAGGVLGRRLGRSQAALGAGLGALLVAHVAAMAFRPEALSLAPLGPELTSRFFGVSNLLETLLLLPALVVAAVLGRRFGWPGFAAAAALAFLAVAENRLGSDGGGAVVLGVGYAVLAVLMSGRRPRLILPALAGAGLVVLALMNVDAAVSGPDHLKGALSGGVSGLATVAAHRVPLAYARVADQWYLVFPLAAIVVLALRSRRWPASRERRALVAAFSAALATSLLVNDSPGPVTLAGLAVFLAVEPLVLRRELSLLAARRVPGPPASVPAPVPVEQTRAVRP